MMESMKYEICTWVLTKANIPVCTLHNDIIQAIVVKVSNNQWSSWLAW